MAGSLLSAVDHQYGGGWFPPMHTHEVRSMMSPFYHDARHQEVEPMSPYEIIIVVIQTAMLVIQAISLGSNNDSKKDRMIIPSD